MCLALEGLRGASIFTDAPRYLFRRGVNAEDPRLRPSPPRAIFLRHGYSLCEWYREYNKKILELPTGAFYLSPAFTTSRGPLCRVSR